MLWPSYPLSLKTAAMLSLFLHRLSVVRVNLSTTATTHGSRGPGSTPVRTHFHLPVALRFLPFSIPRSYSQCSQCPHGQGKNVKGKAAAGPGEDDSPEARVRHWGLIMHTHLETPCPQPNLESLGCVLWNKAEVSLEHLAWAIRQKPLWLQVWNDMLSISWQH